MSAIRNSRIFAGYSGNEKRVLFQSRINSFHSTASCCSFSCCVVILPLFSFAFLSTQFLLSTLHRALQDYAFDSVLATVSVDLKRAPRTFLVEYSSSAYFCHPVQCFVMIKHIHSTRNVAFYFQVASEFGETFELYLSYGSPPC
jgi:hypothetical protein